MYSNTMIKLINNGEHPGIFVYDVSDNAIIGSTSFSILKEYLTIHNESVVMLDSLTPEHDNHNKAFYTGRLISPDDYKGMLYDWNEFRITSIVPETGDSHLNDFMSFCSQSNTGLSYITRTEFDRLCLNNGLVSITHRLPPKTESSDELNYLVVKTNDFIIYGIINKTTKTSPQSFLKIKKNSPLKIMRSSYPNVFKNISTDITGFCFTVTDELDLKIEIIDPMGDESILVVEKGSLGLPYSHLDILNYLSIVKG